MREIRVPRIGMVPIAMLPQVLAACICLAMGISFCVYHQSLKGALVQFGLAALNFGLSARIIRSHQRLNQLRDETGRAMERLWQDQLRRMERNLTSPELLALENLKRIMLLYGAKLEGGRVKVTLGNHVYAIEPGIIYRCPLSGMVAHYEAATCYQTLESMPVFEKMATALLLLHHNPKIFNRWQRHGIFYS